MLEIGLALGVIALFVVVVVTTAVLSVLSLLWLGIAIIVVGMALGLPAGVGYHLAMHRGLTASGIDAPRWWWSPVRYHVQIDAASMKRIKPWFVAGVLGATIAFVGCVILVLCLFRLSGINSA